MKAVVQRVEKASLFIKEKETLKFIGEIGKGLLVFVGIEQEDTTENLYFLADKLKFDPTKIQTIHKRTQTPASQTSL